MRRTHSRSRSRKWQAWSWQWTWVSLKDRRWRPAQTKCVQVVAAIIRIGLDARAACRPAWYYLVGCHRQPRRPFIWPQWHRPNTRGGTACLHLWEASLRTVIPWSTCIKQRRRFASHCSGQLTGWELLKDPDSSSYHKATAKSVLSLSLPARELPAGLSSLETGWGGPGLSRIKPVLTPCSCPFCDFFQWNSIEDQQWANYPARHWGWSS